MPDFEVITEFTAGDGSWIPRGALFSIDLHHPSRGKEWYAVRARGIPNAPTYLLELFDEDIIRNCNPITKNGHYCLNMIIATQNQIRQASVGNPNLASFAKVVLQKPAAVGRWVSRGTSMKIRRCECGAAAVGSPGHSGWCPESITADM